MSCLLELKKLSQLTYHAFKRLQCLHLYFKDFNVFSHLCFHKTTISSFTFQRLQSLWSFIGLNVLVFVLHRTQRSLFLCFKKKRKRKKRDFRCLLLYRTPMSFCLQVFLPWYSLVAQSNSKVARMKLVSLSLLLFYIQYKISKEGQLSYPNFIWGLSFIDILISASRIGLFNTCYHARRKIIPCFGKEYGKYPKGRAKVSF